MIWDEHAYLTIDPDLFEDESNSSMVVEEAWKHAENPLIRLEDKALTAGGRATSLGFIDLIVKDGGRYRMWYQLRGVREALGRAHAPSAKRQSSTRNEEYCKSSYLAYAESDDGIHFKPVRIGQVEIAGSRNNNLLEFPSGGEARTRQCGFLHDPLDAEFPFKCLYYRPGKGKDMEPGLLARYPRYADRDWWFVWGIARSRDGLSWEPPRHRHDLVRANPEHAKLHRALDGGLVISDQMTSPMADWGYRNVKGWITYDLETAHRIPDYLFHVPEHMSRAYGEFVGFQWDRTPWIQPHVGLACARKGSSVVALNGFLYGATGAETFAQVADVGLCVSSTGIKFRPVWPFRPILRRGMRGEWDFGMTAQCAILDDGDRTRFYYTGGDVGNLSSVYLPGLAHVERDRYGYRLIRGFRDVERKPRKASIALKPVALPEKPNISVNCSHVTPRRTIRIELADEKGRAIPGYSLRNCVAVTKGGLKRNVRWRNGRSARELGGRAVRMRIELSSPDCGPVYHDSPRIYAVYTK